jgi:hypothetical protein
MADPIPSPAVLAWSPDRPYTTRTTDWNTGCPVGYFAEFVPADADLTTPLPNGVEGVRCRLLTGDVAALAEESLSWEDTLANLNAAVLETAPSLMPAGGAWWWLLLVALGLGVLGGGAATRVERPRTPGRRAT